MPKNSEYVVYAFGITIIVVSVFYLRMIIKLRSVRRKLEDLTNRNGE